MTDTQHDWSACEIQEEPELHPESDAFMMVGASDQERGKFLEVYRTRVSALVPTDERTVASCGEFVKECTLAAKRVEERRVAAVAPLNKQVDELNGIYMPVRDAFKAMAKSITERVNRFIEDRRREAELEQQRLNAEAAKRQAELDRQAEEARKKAEAANASGDAVKAAVLEGKADILEQKAADVVPMQASLPSRKVDLGDSSVSFGGAKKIWSLNGWDRKKPLRMNDPRLAPLIGDLSKLPAGVQFLLQHGDLNPVHLNASYNGGLKFPSPFASVNDYSGSRVRG